MPIPDLAKYTDDDIAAGVVRLGAARIAKICGKAFAMIDGATREKVKAAIEASPEVAGAAIGDAAGNAAKRFVSDLFAGATKRAGGSRGR